MRVGLVVLPGCFDSGLAALMDIFAAAERARPTVDRTIPPFDVRTVGSAARVTTGGGLTLAVDQDDDAGLDLLVVPGLGATTGTALAEALAASPVRRARALVARAEVPLAAACTGTFVLAEAGRLDDCAATTTWWLAGEFRRRYPRGEPGMSRVGGPSGAITTPRAAVAPIHPRM